MFIQVIQGGVSDLGATPAGTKIIKSLLQTDGTVKMQGFAVASISAAPTQFTAATDQSAITGVPFFALGKS